MKLKIDSGILQTVLRSILFFILIFCVNLATSAQNEKTAAPAKMTATIEGKVTDLRGNPIRGAIITTKPRTTRAVSGADGRYRIPNVPAGSYWVTAETQNRQVGRTRVYVVTPDGNLASGVQIRVRGGGTFQEELRQKRDPLFASVLLAPVGTLVGFGVAGGSFRDSADEARGKFDNLLLTSPGDYLIRSAFWEESQKRSTREDWMRITSLNLLVDSLPFYWYSVRGRRISTPSLFLYYGSQALLFGTWAAIDWDRAGDAETLSDAYADRIQFHEATKQQGRRGHLQERAKWLAINAAVDVGAAYLYWKIVPKSAEGQVHLRFEPQLTSDGVGMAVSGVFR